MEGYIRKIFFLESNSFIVQFFRYAIVGGISAVVDISLFTLLVNAFGMNHLAANTLSFIAGLFINYLLSRKWVFNKLTLDFGRDFLLFAIIGVMGLLLSNLILYILIDRRVMYGLLYFLSDGFIKTFSKIAATFIVLFWNFIARKKFVF